MEKLTAT